MCSCIYSMAAVDFSVYHREFLVKYVAGVEELFAEQKKGLLKNCKAVEVSTRSRVWSMSAPHGT